jgi:hypothetical protein
MFRSLAVLCIAAWPGLLSGQQPAKVAQTRSALESDPKGWLDITPSANLKGWSRVAIPPGGKLSAKNPWSVAADGQTLVCDGVGVHEMLLWDKDVADGIFHVEWRFKKIEDKKGYNSGVYVRNSPDGAVWHQAQVGSKNVGFLFGDTLVGGTKKRVRIDDKSPQRGHEAGAWHTYEITCRGKTISLWINGAFTTVWNDCEVASGRLGMEAEGWHIEFKNLRFKPL